MVDVYNITWIGSEYTWNNADFVWNPLDLQRGIIRNVEFGYNLLNKNDEFIRKLNNILSGEVMMTSLANIKRQCVIELMINDEPIDFLSDRIQPFIKFKYGKQEETYNLGIFLLSSPVFNTQNGIKTARVTCNSKLEILLSDRVKERTFYAQDSRYTENVIKLLKSAGITKVNISASPSTLKRDIDYDVGMTKLEIANDLLSKVNYTSLHTDGEGFVISKPYIRPGNREVELTYKDNETSVIFDDGFTTELDVSRTPNRWLAFSSNPETPPLVSVYENTNPNSPTSIQSRGRVISAKPLRYSDVASQEVLDEKVKRAAEEDLNVYGNIEFSTALMPLHGYLNKLEVEFDGDKYEYIETKWNMRLQAGGRMKHSARRVVQID